MENRFKIHIEQNFPQLLGKSLLIACSGGLDSVVLTHLFHELGYNIRLAHCNFGLRGAESDEDAIFVSDLANRLSITNYSEIFETKSYAEKNKVSTQMAARELRYRWFEQLLEEQDLSYLITAHHADDDLETFLINLSRGSGLKGLTGIPACKDRLIRPLLPFSRNEILAFAKKKNLYWREDSSNAKNDYLRNSLRHNVIPPYKKAAKNILDNFKNTQSHLKDSQALVNDYMVLIKRLVVSEVPEGYAFDLAQLSNLPNPKALLYQLLHTYQFTAWDDIYSMMEAQSGKQVFSSTHRLLKDRNRFILTSRDENSTTLESVLISKSTKKIKDPIQLSLIPIDRMGYTNETTVYINLDKLVFPLMLRKWREGDVFQPFGMKGKKKLSKFFKDEKLSLAAKENIWVLCSDGQIVWVVGHRTDERFKVTNQTKQIIRIEYIPA